MLNIKYRLMNEAGAGEGGGEGGSEVTVEQLQAQMEEIQKSNEALKSKNEELLGETKKAKAVRREAEEAARKAAEEKAKADGDHEQLYKSSEAARIKLQEELTGMKGNIAKEKVNNKAMKLATELADGANAELLSTFISKRIAHTDEGLKVTDENGQLTVSTMDDLKAIFKNDPRYAALLKGNQSSGGGASGGSNSGGAAKQKTRAEFEALDPAARMKFIRDGGQTVD